MTDATQDRLAMQEIDLLRDRQFFVRKRDGRVEEFKEAHIYLAIENAFKARHRVGENDPLPESIRTDVACCADKVVEQLLSRAVTGEHLAVERIQDAVENQLMLGGHLEEIRSFILHRDARRRAQAERGLRDGSGKNAGKLTQKPADEISTAALLASIYSQSLPQPRPGETLENVGRRHFSCYLNEGDYLQCLTPELLEFKTRLLAPQLRWDRDLLLTPAGLEMLYERFLARERERRFETPQYFWMRIAMGLALPESTSPEVEAARFYEVLSTLRFNPSEAILSRAGTPCPSLIDFEEAPAVTDIDRLEIWHRNVLNFLKGPSGEIDLRLWIPDLIVKRLRQQGHWTLLKPSEAAEPQKAVIGSTEKIGQPVMIFNDAVQNRSSTNGNESDCRLGLARPSGAVNLSAHIREDGLTLDADLLRETITAAVRMLDNALDASAYASDRARAATLEHRAIGLGVAGMHETLARFQISPGSAAAADFADWSSELVSHCAILASAQLAEERGRFPGYTKSRWNNGIPPIDTDSLLSRERESNENSSAPTQDWVKVRAMVHAHGLRNTVIVTNNFLTGSAKIAGLTLAPRPVETAPSPSIESAAIRQDLSGVDEPLPLPIRNEVTDTSADQAHVREKGIGRIQPVISGRKSKRHSTAASQRSKTVPAR